ncbi:MAG: alanine dehydrogenase [Myxococcales bacterium]|nr:alanine dehydrogenase [Myxococcales bacterium]
MIVGVPREIKADENRVGIVPAGAGELIRQGHKVLVEAGAGLGSGFADEDYTALGATIVPHATDVWKEAELVVKVKEPIESEYPHIRPEQVLFTYFHFAASEALTQAILKSRSIAIAYETVQLDNGELPLLIPMSEVAGRMAIQEGAKYLESTFGGRGILLGGVPGVKAADVVIIGGGIVGTNAAKMAAGLGARVTILDVDLDRLRYLEDVLPANIDFIYSNRQNILDCLKKADLLVGAVLKPGGKAPNLVTREDLKLMKRGSVIVDVAVDQGGCIETTKPTTHSDPTYTLEGVIHYCVANMPGAVPCTSALALTNATFPYVLALANKGWKRACRDNHALASGVSIVQGNITCPAVAIDFMLDWASIDNFLLEDPPTEMGPFEDEDDEELL